MRLIVASMPDGAPWIGVDLDGTLARYDGWKGDTIIGDPIPEMVERVRQWLREGKEVRIFTARAHNMSVEARLAIEAWCAKHIGHVLPITCTKDALMQEIWDDKAVHVEENTGTVLGKVLNRITAASNDAKTDAINDAKRDVDNKSQRLGRQRAAKKQLTDTTQNKRSPDYQRRAAQMTKRIADTQVDRANSEEKLKHLRGDKKRPIRFK